jgi:hypothetical protein
VQSANGKSPSYQSIAEKQAISLIDPTNE